MAKRAITTATTLGATLGLIGALSMADASAAQAEREVAFCEMSETGTLTSGATTLPPTTKTLGRWLLMVGTDSVEIRSVPGWPYVSGAETLATTPRTVPAVRRGDVLEFCMAAGGACGRRLGSTTTHDTYSTARLDVKSGRLTLSHDTANPYGTGDFEISGTCRFPRRGG